MCLDKGYDFPEVYELLEEYGYTIHIRLRGEEKSNNKEEGIPKYRDDALDAGLLKEPILG